MVDIYWIIYFIQSNRLERIWMQFDLPLACNLDGTFFFSFFSFNFFSSFFLLFLHQGPLLFLQSSLFLSSFSSCAFFVSAALCFSNLLCSDSVFLSNRSNSLYSLFRAISSSFLAASASAAPSSSLLPRLSLQRLVSIQCLSVDALR